MCAAVERVLDAGALPACDGDGDLVVAASSIGERVRSLNCGSRNQNQIRDPAAIERQFDDAHIVHDLADAGASRLHQSGIRLNIDFIGDLSDLKHCVDHGIAVDL